ncbi:MAG: S28 family serine protease [Saprospiraceae bacterium]
MIRLLFSCLILLLPFWLQAQSESIENELFMLPDVIFEARKDLAEGQSFTLKVRQPIDHSNPSKGHFYQKVYLHHRGYDRPTVMVTEGYSMRRHRAYETTKLVKGNQLQIEHRFFGNSIPDSVEYKYLNLKQATADYHHIRQLFDKLYTGKWLSTGISKGGATTIMYRYFYPDDIDVGVPVVAPINDEIEEDRIYKFLDTVGTADCRAKILAIQKEVLSRRDEVVPLIKYFAKGAGADFSYLDYEQAFEYAVLEYPFSFWQWGSDCSKIPATDAPVDTLLEHFLAVSDITFFADGAMKAYASHYYQSAQEFGYYGYETEELKGLLKTFEPGTRPSALFPPNKEAVAFDADVLKGVNKWLKKNGHQMIYIYGANDTWTASAVQPRKGIDSEWFFLEGKSHGGARIKNLTPADRTRMVTAMERWLGMEIE